MSISKFSSAAAPAAVGASLPLADGHGEESPRRCRRYPAAVGASLPLAAGHGEESRRAFGLSGLPDFGLPGFGLSGFRAAPCRFAALAPGHPEPAASAAAASVLFPVRFPARIRPASPPASV